MIYSEASYFEGYHFAHIVAFEEYQRIERKRKQARKLDRRFYARRFV